MTELEFEKNSKLFKEAMTKLCYSEFTIREALIWFSWVKKECLEEAYEHVMNMLKQKADEEKFRNEIYYGYGEAVRRKHTPEEKRRMYEEIIRHRNARNKE